MNPPRNHHFVSQVHIKKFFNVTDKKIFVYDKNKDNCYFKNTSKSLFSERDLNTKMEHGSKDFESLEKDLNNCFESDFPKHFLTINNFISQPIYTEEVNQALLYFAKYGAIGGVRNPREKKSMEDAFLNTFSKIRDHATPELQNNIGEAFSYKKDVKYINSIQYSKFANKIIEAMGDLIFRIEIPVNKQDYFLLPDFCAATARKKINTYFNPDITEIAYIGLPLSSQIYIHFYSSKIENIKAESDVIQVKSNRVFELNKVNLNYCESKVACESKDYLIKFINNVKQHQSTP